MVKTKEYGPEETVICPCCGAAIPYEVITLDSNQVKYIENIKQQCGVKSVNLDRIPIVIHYTAECKPWLNQMPELFEREKYWFFRHLDWSYLIMRPNKIL